MNRRALLTGLAAVIVTAVIACKGGFPAEFPAPDFSLKSPMTSREVTMASLKGKPVVIYWFTSW